MQYIENPDRALVTELLRLDRYVDMIIPRGGAGLHQLCREQSTIPVITGGIGICHVFVDESADLDRAVDIVENAKVQRPSVCNALDTVLVHPRVAAANSCRAWPPRLAQSGVELRADGEALDILRAATMGPTSSRPGRKISTRSGWPSSWASRSSMDLDEAIAHIHEHSTEHSDSILTNDWANATRFVDEVNSAAVFVNASTRFNDGGQFGLGAEVAVSTQKLHARGPDGAGGADDLQVDGHRRWARPAVGSRQQGIRRQAGDQDVDAYPLTDRNRQGFMVCVWGDCMLTSGVSWSIIALS